MSLCKLVRVRGPAAGDVVASPLTSATPSMERIDRELNSLGQAADPPSAGRRRLLRWASGIGASGLALLVGIPSLAAFLAPGLRPSVRKAWTKVADDVSTLDVGTPIKLDFIEDTDDAWVPSRSLRTVWLYTEDGEQFTAYSGVCPHLGCAVRFETEPTEYHAGKDVFHCPCHHGIFDLRSGAVLGGPPPRPLDRLPVKVENGEVYVVYRSFRSGVAERIEV